MQQPESKRSSWQPFCDRCTKADEEILVSVSPKYLKLKKDNPNEMVLENRNPFPVYFKACATNMNAFEPQPLTGRISPLGNTTITISSYAPATPTRHHEEVIILISQRPFFLPEGNACRFCYKPHDAEETEHIGEYTERTPRERTSQELADFEKKTTFICKHCDSQIQTTKDVTQKREGSNVEYKVDTPFIDAEAENKVKGRRVCHHHTCKAHQKDKKKTFPVHSSSSDHSEMVRLCLSADDMQTQNLYFSGDYCKECSGTKIPTRHISSDEMNQQYQYKIFPVHSFISKQAAAVCRCTETDRTKTEDAVFRDSRNKNHSAKHNARVNDDEKQTQYHGFNHEKKVMTDSPKDVQVGDGSSCYCNKRAHIQARIVKARDNKAIADEDSSTISSEDSKREKRTRIISERVITKHEKIKKEQKDSFESATGYKLSNEKPSRYQRKRNTMIVELDDKCTKILNMSNLTFMMISFLLTMVLGLLFKHSY